ncbi:hypothetical protein SAY87_025247 [Trapa incisa]|uniref:C2 domain-containing protein n=1 Tax=Trapa incisa TaxID=236973 RepID=A0AAN7GQH4_9MYRT|nr:hypothetical protein SAY87_025247 [Trapa incisa]
MEGSLGLLRIQVKRGINLAVRDSTSSDPYVVVTMGDQKLKTRTIKNNCNPEWNEHLTLAVIDPNFPILLTVYDKDTFTADDKMGEADIDIRPFLECLETYADEILHHQADTAASGTAIIRRVQPGGGNCLAHESSIFWKDGKIVQDMILRLREVTTGEVELQLQWIDLPGGCM